MFNDTFTLALAALYVSQPAYDLYESRKNSKHKEISRTAIVFKARSVLLLDRVMRNDFRGFDQDKN